MADRRVASLGGAEEGGEREEEGRPTLRYGGYDTNFLVVIVVIVAAFVAPHRSILFSVLARVGASRSFSSKFFFLEEDEGR